jgi:KipI family sensor histidine kinase inhibitor
VNEKIAIKPAGDSALVLEFEERIDPEVSARVLAVDRALAAARIAGVQETLPTYRTLLVRFDPEHTDIDALQALMLRTARDADAATQAGRLWRVPVAYGGAHGIDLDDVARAKQMSTEEIIRRHGDATYHVYMIGFVPGYTYLGGLDPLLHHSRRENPRLVVPRGTVSIGGQQAAIQSIEAPSGWHLLGRTPLRLFDMRREKPFLIEPGERVRFTRVTAAEFDRLDALAERGAIVAECEEPR